MLVGLVAHLQVVHHLHLAQVQAAQAHQAQHLEILLLLKMVEHHYPDLGFSPLPEAATAQYSLEVDSYREKECFIES